VVVADALALEEWGRTAPLLVGMGLLRNLDRAVFAAYCVSSARFVRAEQVLGEMAKRDKLSGGLLTRSAAGHVMKNPALHISRAAAATMMLCAQQLGMTPLARSRISAAGESPPSPADKYFS
jgi:P27 family predicted phage terminase small subunit